MTASTARVPAYEFTPAQEKALRRARLLSVVSLLYMASVIALMGAVMGQSQAMRTAWIEDILSLIPPLCFLFGSYVCWREPTVHYPYGFHRVISILHLCAALALLLLGGALLFDGAHNLLSGRRPAIGLQEHFGHDIWAGWWMILVLLWGTFPPLLLGHLKQEPARALNDKILTTDSKMNKADWMTAAAAMAGVLGIGAGLWWADSAAAMLIAADILRDGWVQTRDAVTGLINRAPTNVETQYSRLPQTVRENLERLPWVEKAQIRLYEHGHLIYGDGLITVKDDEAVPPSAWRAATADVRALDWRLQGFILSVVPSPPAPRSE